jgi:hypothetical protein
MDMSEFAMKVQQGTPDELSEVKLNFEVKMKPRQTYGLVETS